MANRKSDGTTLYSLIIVASRQKAQDYFFSNTVFQSILQPCLHIVGLELVF